MEIFEADSGDARMIAEELWLPLAREMEDLSDYNELAEGDVAEKSREYRQKRLKEDDYTSFVAEVDGEKAGFVTVHDREHAPVFAKGVSGEISELFVKEEFRRQGVARKLIETAEEWCRGRGLDAVELSVDRGNRKARELYRDEGYEAIRTRMRKEDIGDRQD